MLNDFRKFIMRGNVIDLAVGIIIGSAFTAIVQSLVNDIIMPPLGYLLNDVDFSNLFIVLGEGSYDSLTAAQEAGAATINYGIFLNAIITFLIVAGVVFLLIRAINRIEERLQTAEDTPDPSTKKCPYCYSEIAIKASRCPHCTSQLENI